MLQDYGFRPYLPALGRFFSVDPLASAFPWYTPYQFAGNKPINSIDLDGLEEWEVNDPSPAREYGEVNGPYKSSLEAQLAANSDPRSVTWRQNLPQVEIYGESPGSDGTFETWYKGGQQEIIVPNKAPDNLYGNRTDAFRAWSRESSQHAGESVSDMWVRLAASGSYQARRDWASGDGFASGSFGRAEQVGVTLATVERSEALTAKTSTAALTNFYPANNGFLGAAERTFLMPGEQISRYGSGAGKFFSPTGTPLPMRALPPGANTGIFNTYKVLKPFEVQSGKIAPAFGQPGMGTQYLSPVSADVLIERGIIGH
jgi:Tuberculosis necrotizing toxin